MNKPGDKKPRVGILPDYLIEIVRVLEHGAAEHGERDWAREDRAPDLFADAAWRHAERIRVGELIDPKSGMPHAAHLGANAMIFGVKTKARDSGLVVPEDEGWPPRRRAA